MGDIRVEHDVQGQRFVAQVGEAEAVIEYERPDPRTLDLHHTYTPPAARGLGVAGALARAALDHARAQGLRVIPTCPYVATFLERHPEYADLASGGGGARGG